MKNNQNQWSDNDRNSDNRNQWRENAQEDRQTRSSNNEEYGERGNRSGAGYNDNNRQTNRSENYSDYSKPSYEGNNETYRNAGYRQDQYGQNDNRNYNDRSRNYGPGNYTNQEGSYQDVVGSTGSSRYGRGNSGQRSNMMQGNDGSAYSQPGAGAGQHRGKGPKNYKRSDERILEAVNDTLTDDVHIDASDIEATVSNGEVTLSGTVDSRFAKRHAEDITDPISGVTNVENRIRVRQQQDHYQQTDDNKRSSAGSSSTGNSSTGNSKTKTNS